MVNKGFLQYEFILQCYHFTNVPLPVVNNVLDFLIIKHNVMSTGSIKLIFNYNQYTTIHLKNILKKISVKIINSNKQSNSNKHITSI